MKPVEIPYTKSPQFTKERIFDAKTNKKRTPRKLKKKLKNKTGSQK